MQDCGRKAKKKEHPNELGVDSSILKWILKNIKGESADCNRWLKGRKQAAYCRHCNGP
jgi:hypothetical protein